MRDVTPADDGRPIQNLPEALPELTFDNFPYYRLIIIPQAIDQADLLRRFEAAARPEYGEVTPNQFFGGARMATRSRIEFYAGVAKRGAIEVHGTTDDIANKIEGILTKLMEPPKAQNEN